MQTIGTTAGVQVGTQVHSLADGGITSTPAPAASPDGAGFQVLRGAASTPFGAMGMTSASQAATLGASAGSQMSQ